MTSDFDFQSKKSYSYDPHMQKIKVKGQSVQNIEWKQMDGQMEAIALSPVLMRVVTIKIIPIRKVQQKPSFISMQKDILQRKKVLVMIGYLSSSRAE